MIAINKKTVFFSFFLWMLLVQSIFYFQQENSGNKILGTIESQLREELNTSNYLQISKNITDYTYLKFIKCAKLEKIGSNSSLIIDLSYMEKSCENSFLALDGFKFQTKFKSLNGDRYLIQFISNNSESFMLALWFSRFIGILLCTLLYWIYILDQKNKKLQTEQKIKTLEETRKLALQVAHDIRSPLAVINSMQLDIYDIKQKELFKNAITRINSISDDLLNRNKSHSLEKSQLNLQELIAELVLNKTIEKSYKVNFESNLNNIYAELNASFFSRVISNILNNSFEATLATNRRIDVVLDYVDNNAIISIKDNGVGVPQDILDQIGIMEISSKQNNQFSGSGLGLLSAFNYISSINGQIEINSKLSVGTEIKISIPAFIKTNDQQFILIDDDQLTQLNWETTAKKKNIKLIIFNSPNKFFEKIEQIDKSSFIYIDSELGDMKGEFLAQTLNNLGFLNLNMTTGYSKEKFTNFPFLKSIIDKTPPF